MADNHIGAVLVSDQRGIAGIVTDRDLALAVLGSDLHPKTTRLRDVMSEEIAVCGHRKLNECQRKVCEQAA